MATKTITFHGLCLFAHRASGPTEVCLLEPDHAHDAGVHHVSVLRTRLAATQRWKAEVLSVGDHHYGVGGATTTVDTALYSLRMNRLKDMAVPFTIPPFQYGADHVGSRFLLTGGTLSADSNSMGDFVAIHSDGTIQPIRLASAVVWIGEVAPGVDVSDQEVWHGPHDEVPLLSETDSTMPGTVLTDHEVRLRVVTHTSVFFPVLKTPGNPLIVVNGPIRSLVLGVPRMKTLYTSSCPSGLVTEP